ncbi:MAG: hypothetical protein Q8Q42_03995 [Nanoarchaeota archaeon]|nr:hypothetical protein [Nanoarchaeota archaeon]
MKKTRQMKNLTFFVLALVAVIGSAISVSAVEFNVINVKIDGQDMAGISSYDVERGDRIDISVLLEALNDTDDVIITARIMGYEYGSVMDSTSQFSVEAGNTYRKTLSLIIPDDIDSSEEYTLRVDVSDKKDEVTQEVTLHIDEQRHGLQIYDVLVNPSSTIAAGNPLFATVRLINYGEKEENDIKVTVSIPALGVSTVNFMDELNTEIQERDEDHLRNDNSDQLDFLLRIPETAESGTYEMRVDVEYNRGFSFLSQSMNVNVIGAEKESGVQTVLNSDSNSKVTNAGETVNYKIMLANLGNEPGVYTVQVDGVSTWGEAGVQPSFLTIMPDSTGEVTISITPFASEEDASHTWVARIMVGTSPLSEMVFTTKVEGAEVITVDEKDTLKSVLAVIFGLLVVVLIVLALLIAFRKIKGDEEENSSVEGQTYYQYYPKN